VTTALKGSLLLSLLLAGVSVAECREAVWAVNVGGPDYLASDGTLYRAEEHVSGGHTGQIETVLGASDATLYQTYRQGNIRIDAPLPSGRYDLTFHFAEPEDMAPGERLFDVFVEGQKVLGNADVMLMRDGKVRSALTVTVPDLMVSDDELNIHLGAVDLQPILSGLLVRQAVPPPASWDLVWSDEFDQAGAPDTERWTLEDWPAGVVNTEDQAYTQRLKNARVENGVLIIEAHQENYQGADYTSARLQSAGKGDFLYGRFEVRARLPAGRGTWAAIWMLPSDPYAYATNCSAEDTAVTHGNSECNAWPNSGEIDIMEFVGYQQGNIHATVHTSAYYFSLWNQRKGRILIDQLHEEFHVYALEWSPERIDVFVDDSLYFTYTRQDSDWRTWPFDKPFHFILNLAIGGSWGRAGGPIDNSIFPQQMVVDYVRVYQPQVRPE